MFLRRSRLFLKYSRITLHWLTRGGLALFFTFFGLLFYVQTPAGRQILGDLVAYELSGPTAKIKIADVGGAPPRSFIFKGVTIADGKGVWARIGKVDLSIDPLALLGGTVAIETLQFHQVDILRQPLPTPPKDKKPFRVPDLPVDIRLDSLTVQGLRLEKAVVGVAAEMAVDGKGLWKKRSIKLDLDVKRTDAATDRIKATISLGDDPATRRAALTTRLELRGDPGGVFAGLVGLKSGRGVTASLKGDGPLNGWDGNLAIKAGGLGTLDGHVKVTERAQDVAIGFTGKADLAPIMAKDVAAKFGTRIQADGEAIMARGRPLGYRLKLANAALVATASSPGDVHAKTRRWTIEAKIRDASYFKSWTNPASLKAAVVKAVVDGSFARPRVQFDVQIDGLAAPQVTAAGVKASGDFKLLETAAGWSGSGQLKGRFSRLSVAGSGSGPATIFDQADFSLTSGLDGALHVLTIDNFAFNGGGIAATATGQISLQGGASNLHLQATAADLGLYQKLARMPLKGGVALDVALARTAAKAPLLLTGTLRGRDFALGNDAVDKLLGPDVEIIFDGAHDPDQTFRGKMDVKGRIITADLAGGFARGAFEHTKFHIKVVDVPGLSALVALPLPPSIRLDGTAEGTPADLAVEGRLVSDDLIRRRLKLTDIKGQFSFKNLGSAPQGQMSFDMKLPAGDLHAAARLATFNHGTTRIDGITLTAPETVVKGGLLLVPGQPAVGSFTGNSTNLKILARQFDLEAGGSADASLILKDQGGRQKIDMTVNGQQLSSVLPNRDVIKMDKVTLTASAYRDEALHDLDLDLKMTGLRAATAEVTSLTLSAKGEGRAAQFNLALDGNFRGRVAVTATGQFTDQAQGFNLTLASVDGTVYDRNLKLNKPFYVISGPRQLTAAPLDLTFGQGHVAGSWQQGPDGLTVGGVARNLDLVLLSLVYPEAPVNGRGDATVGIKVVNGSPAGAISVNLRHVTTALKRGEDSPPAAAILTAKIDGTTMLVSGGITVPNQLAVTLNGSLPLSVNQARQTVSLAKDVPIKAQIGWKGEVATLWNMTPPSDHRISGILDGNVAVSGTLADPQFQGKVAIKDGAYDSLSLGLVARQIEAALSVNGRRVTVASAKASDASGGSFEATGWVDLLPKQHFPAALDLKLDKARIIRTSDIRAAASAVLAYSRTKDHAALSGNADVREIDSKLVSRLPPEVPAIEVTEINLPPAETGGVTTRVIGGKKQIPYPTNVNVHLKAARRVFVRGRGLDSEWKGDLDVEGAVDKPRIAGEMSLVRGTFTLAGKEFILTEGTLNFTAGDKIDPIINLRAEYKMTDLTAVLLLNGPASKPRIKLTSTPELPQEEVMSRILFGTSVAQLGPLEAVQLGGAVASLSGSGGGLDLVNIARTTLGLDRLRFQSSPDKSAGALIAGGKYLTNNIYLEVETATGTGQSVARVKVNITENLIVESDVGSANASGVGLKWQKDY